MCASPTATVTLLLVAAVQTVGVGVAAPANGDAVAVFALVLVVVALDVAAVLEAREEQLELCDVPQSSRRLREAVGRSVSTSSEPSAQSWSPSHFQRPAMQRPFVQANSLSEHWRGTDGRGRRKLRDLASGDFVSFFFLFC